MRRERARARTTIPVDVPPRRREISSRNWLPGGGGGRNSASNTVLASDEWLGRMDVWKVGEERVRRERTVEVALLLPPSSSQPPLPTPASPSAAPHPGARLFVFAQRVVAHFEAARMLPAVSSETGIPDGPRGRDGWWRDPRARSGRRKHAGAN